MATKREIENGKDLLKHRDPLPAQPPSTSRIDLIAARLSAPIPLAVPEYQEVFEDRGISEVVCQITDIMQQYKKGFEPRITEANDDLMRLSSLYANLAMHVGAIQGFAYHAEQNLKVGSAQLYSRAISIAETTGTRLTNNEATSITRIMTKDQRELAASYETAARVLNNYMFAVKEFISTLQFVKGSSDREILRV